MGDDNSSWKDKIFEGEATLSLLKQHIEYNDLDEFINVMKAVPLFDLQEEKATNFQSLDLYVSDMLLETLLGWCKDNDREKFIKPILDIWDQTEFNYFQQPTMIRLFMYRFFPLDTLYFVSKSLKYEWSYIDIIRYLIKMDSSPEVEYAAICATKVYGIQKYQDYVTLAKWADLEVAEDGWGNDRINWFIQDMLKKTKPRAKAPSYMITSDKNVYGGNFRKMIDSLPDTYNVIPSDVSIISTIESAAYPSSVKDIETYYQVSDAMQYRFMINPTSFHQFKVGRAQKVASLDMLINANVFKILGPANTFITSALDENHPCDRYGGCRMLVCDQFEVKPFDSIESSVEIYDIISDYDYTYNPNSAPNAKMKDEAIIRKFTGNWFTGSCFFCFSKIKKLEYAAREPLANGGWRRCYCSWRCVKKQLLSEPESKERDIKYYLAVNFAKTCHHIGIYERS
jgi:hypothetical protein